MHELSLFGPVHLTGSDGRPVLSVLKQPKRIALLAFLATAPSSARTREEVLDVLWHDADREKARHALSQAVYYVRRSLGKDVILNGGEVLSLNPDAIRTDVDAFLRALEEGRLREALDLYRGDLLHGFVLDSEAEVDRWLDGARERLHQRALEATDLLSRQAERGADLRGAISWAERGVSLSPLREAPMRRLLSLLMAVAEPVRARETLERFRVGLLDALDMEPSPETLAIVLSPPADPAETRKTPPVTTAPPAPPTAVPSAPALAGPKPDGLEPPISNASPRASFRLPRLWRRPAAVVGVLSLLGVGAYGISRATQPLPADAMTTSRQRVGVFPFSYGGRPDLAYLAEGLPELLSISASGLAEVTTVDPRVLSRGLASEGGPAGVEEARRIARKYGADHYVIGSVLEAGGQIQVSAEFHDTEGNRVVTVSERAQQEIDLFQLVDDLVRRLVASEAFPNSSQLERAAALTTSSLPAFRDFLQGERMFRAGLFHDATHAFDAATREDSTFALAFYRGAVASLWSHEADFDAARAKLAKARAYRSRVSELEGLLFDALNEFLEGHLFGAEVLYESVLARQPENLEALFQLGETRFHYGGLRGQAVAESEEQWRRILAIDPDDRAALIHLSAVAAREGDPGLDTLEAHLTTLGADSVAVPQIRALRVFASGSEREKAAFVAGMRRLPMEAVTSTASYVARYLRDIAAADRIVRVLTAETRPAADRVEGYSVLAYLELARGRTAAAERALSAVGALDPASADLHRLVLSTLPNVALKPRSGGTLLEVPLGVSSGPHRATPANFDGSIRSGLVVYGRALAYAKAGGEDGALLAASRTLLEDASPEARSFLEVLHTPSAPRDGCSVRRMPQPATNSPRRLPGWSGGTRTFASPGCAASRASGSCSRGWSSGRAARNVRRTSSGRWWRIPPPRCPTSGRASSASPRSGSRRATPRPRRPPTRPSSTSGPARTTRRFRWSPNSGVGWRRCSLPEPPVRQPPRRRTLAPPIERRPVLRAPRSRWSPRTHVVGRKGRNTKQDAPGSPCATGTPEGACTPGVGLEPTTL